MKGKRLRGMIAAPVTPVNKSGNLDTGLLKNMVDVLIDKKVEGFFALGTTGNFPLFSVDERKKGAEDFVKAANGRVPVCIQVGATAEHDIMELAAHAGSIGADAFGSVPPYYFKYDAETLVGFFRRVAAVNPEMPFYAYNIPSFAGSDITPGILRRMLKEIPNLAGMKETTQDFVRFLDCVDVSGTDFDNIMGSDAMCIAALDAGGAGGICAMATHNPELMVDLFNHWRKGEREKAQRLQMLAARLRLLMRRLPYFTPRIEIMRMRGIIHSYNRLPIRDLSEAEMLDLVTSLHGLEDEFGYPLLNAI